MTPMVTAALLICSTSNPEVAALVEQEAGFQDIDPAWALVVGVLESGLKEGNTMGVRACYGKKARQKGTRECVRIGVASLHNRLWDVHTSIPPVKAIRECGKSGHMQGCRALARYNNAPGILYTYARRGVALYFKLHKLAATQPET